MKIAIGETVDPGPFIEEVVKDAKKRASRSLASPSFLTDSVWEELESTVRTRGPLKTIEEERESFILDIRGRKIICLIYSLSAKGSMGLSSGWINSPITLNETLHPHPSLAPPNPLLRLHLNPPMGRVSIQHKPMA